MRKKAIFVLVGMLCIYSQFVCAKSDSTQNADKKAKALLIEDFEDESVLGRVGANDGVTFSLTQEDAVSGKHALEVRVSPFSQHKNSWPYLYFVKPKFFSQPLDLTNYSKISMTIRNVTEGLAGIAIEGSTLPYNDGGRNFCHESFLIPGGTSWICGLPVANFVYAGTKEEDGRSIPWNDPSNIQHITIRFPANETNAVYRIDAMQAVYDSAMGSPAEKLKTDLEKLQSGFGEIKRKINWKNIDEKKRESVQEQCVQLGTTIEKLVQSFKEYSLTGFQGKYISLKREADDVSRKMSKLVLVDKKDFFAWEIDPYLNIFRDEAPQVQNAELKKIEIQMAQNEFRDAVFMVSACGKDLKLEVKCKTGTNIPADAILVQETLYLNNTIGEEVGDAVYQLTNPLAIPSGQSRQIRLRFDSRYADLKPGKYSFSISLCDLNTGVEKNIPGSLEVWGFRLPSYDILANNSWSEFQGSEFASPELTAKAVAHMKIYGLNQVFIHPVEMPRTIVDSNGNLLKFDNTAFENRLRAIQKGWNSVAGDDRLQYQLCMLIINSFHLDRPDIDYTDKNQSGEPTPKWKAIFPQYYANLKETTRRLGIADKDLVMVLHDEPSESWMINGVIPLAQAIKDIDPNAVITSNTSNTLRDPAYTKRLYDLIDIFQPHFPGLKDTPALYNWVKASGKTMWTYKCLGGFSRRNKNPYEYYRVYGWDLVKYGLTGTGVWTYCAQGGNIWNSADGGAILVFKHPTKDEVVHSRRYEMFREGADDYRYVAKLREVAKLNGGKSQADAEQLIQNAIADITADVCDTSRCEKWRITIAQKILQLQKSR